MYFNSSVQKSFYICFLLNYAIQSVATILIPILRLLTVSSRSQLSLTPEVGRFTALYDEVSPRLTLALTSFYLRCKFISSRIESTKPERNFPMTPVTLASTHAYAHAHYLSYGTYLQSGDFVACYFHSGAATHTLNHC